MPASTLDNSTFVDPICEVCPPGTLISDDNQSLQLPSIAGGGTCKSVASMALGGCFDSMHCLFLQQMFLLRCCIYPSPDLPTPALGDFNLIDVKNNTIVPDDTCDDVSYGAKNATSPFPGGNDDGACYMLGDGVNGTFQDELCLENVFGELCLGTIDGALCDSCDMDAATDSPCQFDGGLPGVHLDCSGGTPYTMDIDICYNGKVFLSEESKICFIMDDVVAGIPLEQHLVCVDQKLPDTECFASLDGTSCNSCSLIDPDAKENKCKDGMNALRLDCTNEDPFIDVDICGDGMVVDIRPPPSSMVTYEPKKSGSSLYYIFVLPIAYVAYVAFKRMAKRATFRSGYDVIGSTSMDPDQGTEFTTIHPSERQTIIA